MSDPKLQIVPATLRDARKFVDLHHRHHRAPQGGLFAVGLGREEDLVGVAIVGMPVARGLADGWTCELTRLAVLEGADQKNGCSMLYGACWRAARALGWRTLITYTLKSEPGTSLRAAGWEIVGEVRGRSWHTPRRPRLDKHPLDDKYRWEPAA